MYFSQHLPEEYMNIHHLLLSPAFVPHLKHFMKVRDLLPHLKKKKDPENSNSVCVYTHFSSGVYAVVS